MWLQFENPEIQHNNAHFSTYSKASVSLTLEDTSRYLQGRYIESSYYPSQVWTYKNVLFASDKRPPVVQFSAVVRQRCESFMTQQMHRSRRAQNRIRQKQKQKKEDEKEARHPELHGEATWVNRRERTVVSTDKPLKRLCECVLLSLRLLKEHRQPWSDPRFSWETIQHI